MSDEEMRDRVVRLAFDGDRDLFRKFYNVMRAQLPRGTGVALRGSAVRASDGMTARLLTPNDRARAIWT